MGIPSQDLPESLTHQLLKMPYPETATGFMIEDQKKWQDFKKQEFKLKTIKEGDRVGVGAQIQADLTCANCKADQENYCPNAIDTFGAQYSDGTLSQGGYSSHIRAHEYFTFKIPESIPSAVAAPMMCAGLTVYSPLVRLGAGPGKKVAILGLGVLGHFAVMWAVALGAEVYVLSHSPSKKEDALKMGAKEFIVTGEENWHKPY